LEQEVNIISRTQSPKARGREAKAVVGKRLRWIVVPIPGYEYVDIDFHLPGSVLLTSKPSLLL
jgi:hypothetical protein